MTPDLGDLTSDMSNSPTRASATPEMAVNRVLQAYEEQLHQLASLRSRSQRLQYLLTATDTLEDLPLCPQLSLNLQTLRFLFDACSDWVLREFRIAGGRAAAMAFFEGIVERDALENQALKPLMYQGFPVRGANSMQEVRQLLEEHVVPAGGVRRLSTVKEVVDHILHGDAVLLIDGETSALVVSFRGFQQRSVTEPDAEAVIRGPREGFVENLRTNTALLRRRIRSPQLKMESRRIGRFTRTDVVIAYIQGVATESLVQEVAQRLSRIDIDGIVDSGYVEDLIEDDPYSPFPQVLHTERPDVVAGNLLEGRVAILVDGSPSVLIVPTTLWSLLEANEDWYARVYIGIFLRTLRFIFGTVALVAPALYVAALTYHQEMIPTSLLLTIAATREGIPFPTLVEALIMELLFEALREAGVRLPKMVGQAVSIVGALVIGQAAVQAGIVSAPMVIVVATTGIASFTFPRFNLGISIRLLRFPLIVLAGILGMFGVMIGLLLILVHLCGLRSFGTAYLQPMAPLDLRAALNVVTRPPLWARRFRPPSLAPANPRRQGPALKSGPAPWEEQPAGPSPLRDREGER